MSETMIQRGTAVLNPGTEDMRWGLCTDFERSLEADKEQVKQGDGATVGLLYTDPRTKYSCTYTPLAAATEADPPLEDAEALIGKLVTVKEPSGTEVSFYIDSATLTGKQGGVPTFKLEGYKYSQVQEA